MFQESKVALLNNFSFSGPNDSYNVSGSVSLVEHQPCRETQAECYKVICGLLERFHTQRLNIFSFFTSESFCMYVCVYEC